jgi:uncharacterized membrane protein YraQ (UPF0718 family)
MVATAYEGAASEVMRPARGVDDGASARTTSRFTRGVWLLLVVGAICWPTFWNRVDDPAIKNWGTILISLTLQAVPFLVLGVVLSAVLSAFVSPKMLARVVPRNTAIAIPTAALAATALPGCECSSVPLAGRLVSRVVPPAAALTFLLAAPAVNPVVLVATAVAFPGRPQMVLARFVAAMLAAMLVGFVWSRFFSHIP